MNCIKCGGALPGGALYCPACGKKQTGQPRKHLKRANGTGTVYKLSGRRKRPWVAAKNRITIGYCETRTEALLALEHVSGKKLTEQYNMTFKDVFEGWKEEHYKTVGTKSVSSYDRAYDVFEPLHGQRFRALRTRDFQAVMDQYSGRSYSMLAKLKNLIMQMSQWAIREEICTTNFAKFVQLPEKGKKEKEIFTDTEIKKLEDDGSEAAQIVLMLIYTGMRIGELFALPLEDYHETYVIGGSKTDAGRERVIPIRPKARQYFAAFAAKGGPLLLSKYKGQHDPDNFRKRDYYPLLARLGIEKKTPHATRHTYASQAVKHGVQPELLQKILGHADYSTTANIYTHIDVDTLVKSVEGY